MKAKLIDGGDVIAQLVIEEVFPDGSRLKAEGELSRLLSTDARVDVMIPIP
ncbi:MAG: hypothetical protein NZ808_00535 [Myxococcota bacterium]|nr:hypothetical protein [Myxococcota bacterium]